MSSVGCDSPAFPRHNRRSPGDIAMDAGVGRALTRQSLASGFGLGIRHLVFEWDANNPRPPADAGRRCSNSRIKPFERLHGFRSPSSTAISSRRRSWVTSTRLSATKSAWYAGGTTSESRRSAWRQMPTPLAISRSSGPSTASSATWRRSMASRTWAPAPRHSTSAGSATP